MASAARNSSVAGVPVVNHGATARLETIPSASRFGSCSMAGLSDWPVMAMVGWKFWRPHEAPTRLTVLESISTNRTCTPAFRAARHSAVKSGWVMETLAL